MLEFGQTSGERCPGQWVQKGPGRALGEQSIALPPATAENTKIAHLVPNLADILLFCALAHSLPSSPPLTLGRLSLSHPPCSRRLLSLLPLWPPSSLCSPRAHVLSFSAAHPRLTVPPHPVPCPPSALLVLHLLPFSFVTTVPPLCPTSLQLSHPPQAPVSASQTFLPHFLGSSETLSSCCLAERSPANVTAPTQAPHFSHKVSQERMLQAKLEVHNHKPSPESPSPIFHALFVFWNTVPFLPVSS